MTDQDQGVNHENGAVLRAGLAWLFDTEQPEGALIQHHGTGCCVGDRSLRFIPTTPSGAAVVIEVADPKHNPVTFELLNPIRDGEMAEWAERLDALGYPVTDAWNGDGFTSGSLATGRPAHASLRAAERVYHAGCPVHKGSVFCACGWYPRGNDLMVMPDFKSVLNV